jgi:hypothetical protein
VKRKKQEHKVDTVRMEASRRTKDKARFQGLVGLEAEPLDLLAIEILKEHPRIIPDVRETLKIVRENAFRLGISPTYEVKGSIDPEYPDLKRIRVWIHVGRGTSVQRSMEIWNELTMLNLSKLHDDSSVGKIVLRMTD